MKKLEPGRVIAHLRIEKEIGHGAFGTVYLASDELIGRRVAVKHLRPPSALSPVRELRERVLREARAVGKLNSPYIAMLHQLHELEDEGWLLEMEYVASGSLSDLVSREAPLSPQRVAELAGGIFKGLGAAHDGGLVHGDMKPGNVLLAQDGSPKLVDFGLSWMVDDVSMSRSGSEGPVGTPAYMSPEVIMGARGTIASDLWSVGVMLHRMLADDLPFPANTLHELFLAVQNEEPQPLPAEVPVWLQGLVTRLLQKRPEDRPGSCAEALDYLEPSTTAELVAEPAAKRVGVARPPEQWLVGRDEEHAILREALDRLGEGSGGAVLLSGEAGMGKSALLRVLARDAADRGFSFVKASVTTLEGLVRPLIEATLAAIEAESDGASLGATPPATALRTLLQEQSHGSITSRQQVVWALEQVFEALTERRPVVLVFDNTQYGQPEDWQLLRELVQRLPRRRAFVVTGFRTHDIEASASTHSLGGYHELASVAGIRQIALGPLTQEAMLELLRKRAEVERVDSEVAAWLIGQAEGNPFFAEQMLSHLVEHGAVEFDNKTLVSGPKWQKVAIPHRFQELVNLRLAGLSDMQRELLDTAAIDGRVFDAEALQAILERPLLGILRELQSLYRDRNLVEPAGDAFRFTSGLVQEVIVQGIAPALCKAIHQSLAQHLESRGDDAGVSPERLAVHWHEGGDQKRAAPYFLKAAAGAAGRQERRRAIDLFEKAGTVSDAVVATHAGTLLDICSMYETLGRMDAADEVSSSIRAVAQRLGDSELQQRAYVRRARQIYYREGAASVDCERLRSAAVALSALSEGGGAWYLLGLVSKYRGELEDARGHLERADQIYEKLGRRGDRSSVLDQLASLKLRSGQFAEAEGLYAKAAIESSEAGRRSNALVSGVNAAIARFELGNLDSLEERLMHSIDGLLIEGAPKAAAFATVVLGQVRFALGRTADAEAAVRSALSALKTARSLPAEGEVKQELGHLASVRGDYAEAETLLAEATRIAERLEDRQALANAHAHMAQVLCFRGDAAGAIPYARKATATLALLPPSAAAYVGLVLAETVLHGLPFVALAELPETQSDIQEFAAAVNAFGQPDSDAEALVRGAEFLRDRPPGRRRSTLEIVGQWLWSDAIRRRGALAEARSFASGAADAAQTLGHVCLESRIREWLDRHSS